MSYFHALKKPTNQLTQTQNKIEQKKNNKAPWKAPQTLVGKNSRSETHKSIVWNTRQNLKHTAEPGVLILPHWPQINNYGLLCTTGSLSCQLSSSPRSLSLSVTHFPVSRAGIFDFFRLVTSTVTVDAPGAERRMNQFCVHSTHCWELLTQSRRVPQSCTLTAGIEKWQ